MRRTAIIISTSAVTLKLAKELKDIVVYDGSVLAWVWRKRYERDIKALDRIKRRNGNMLANQLEPECVPML